MCWVPGLKETIFGYRPTLTVPDVMAHINTCVPCYHDIAFLVVHGYSSSSFVCRGWNFLFYRVFWFWVWARPQHIDYMEAFFLLRSFNLKGGGSLLIGKKLAAVPIRVQHLGGIIYKFRYFRGILGGLFLYRWLTRNVATSICGVPLSHQGGRRLCSVRVMTDCGIDLEMPDGCCLHRGSNHRPLGHGPRNIPCRPEGDRVNIWKEVSGKHKILIWFCWSETWNDFASRLKVFIDKP